MFSILPLVPTFGAVLLVSPETDTERRQQTIPRVSRIY